MRYGSLAFLAVTLLLATSAAWAADPVACAVPQNTEAPAFSRVIQPDAAQLPSTPQPLPAASFCPDPPVETCESCTIGAFPGTPSTHTCWLFCVNGMPRKSCQPCGEVC